MTRFLIFSRLALAALLFVALESHVDADTNIGSLSGAPAPMIDFSGEIETPMAVELSETGGACVLPLGNTPLAGCNPTETVNLTSADFGDDASGPLFLLSVLAFPQPSDVEMSIAIPVTSAAPQQQPYSLWLLVGLSTAIALIGASGALRFRRTSANRI
jgi:hypothetical protein